MVCRILTFLHVLAVFVFTKNTATVINMVLPRYRISKPGGVFIYFNNFSCFWIVLQLLFKRIVGPSVNVFGQDSTSLWGRELFNCRMNVKAHTIQIRSISFVSVVQSKPSLKASQPARAPNFQSRVVLLYCFHCLRSIICASFEATCGKIGNNLADE